MIKFQPLTAYRALGITGQPRAKGQLTQREELGIPLANGQARQLLPRRTGLCCGQQDQRPVNRVQPPAAFPYLKYNGSG